MPVLQDPVARTNEAFSKSNAAPLALWVTQEVLKALRLGIGNPTATRLLVITMTLQVEIAEKELESGNGFD